MEVATKYDADMRVGSIVVYIYVHLHAFDGGGDEITACCCAKN